jgi:hypothetical protein
MRTPVPAMAGKQPGLLRTIIAIMYLTTHEQVLVFRPEKDAGYEYILRSPV